MFFYYGLKYTFILRANIIIAETALKAPRAAFGIGNLKSRSPARFLFIQLQITGFGGCAVTALAGTLCMLWVLFKDNILSMSSDKWPHIMAVFWTCAIAVAFFVVMTLVAAQSIRSRKRAMNEPSTTTSISVSGGGQKKSGQQSSHNHGSDPEAQLTQNSSCDDDASLDSEKASLERYEDPRYMIPEDVVDRDKALAAASVAAMIALSDRMDQEANKATAGRRTSRDRDSWTTSNPTSPAKPLTIQISGTAASNIRESVFGGRTPREDGTISPTGGGFSLPAFPLITIRTNSRNSMEQPSRPSLTLTNPTSSNVSYGSSKHGTSSSESYSTSSYPTQSMCPVALQQQTQQQIQQLEQQQPAAPRSIQRVQIKGGGAFALESPPYSAGGDLSSPPHSPNRTRFNDPRMPISIPMPPNMGSSQQYFYDDDDVSMPLPPTTASSTRTPASPTRSSPRFVPHPHIPADLNLAPDMQLQQQHPLHQVAFKGLSPPPRSTPQSPISPSTPVRRNGSLNMTSPPVSPTAISHPLNSPSSPGMQSYQSQQGQVTPRVGGGVRRGTGSSSVRSREQEILSEQAPTTAAAVVASRGAGGGYSQRGAEVPVPVPVLQAPPRQHQHQHQQQQQQQQSLRNKNTTFRYQQQEQLQQPQQDDNRISMDSTGDAFPLPPTYKS